MRDVPEPLDDAVDVRLKLVVQRAIDEAARRGAANVEAEHLLLVISAGDDAAGRALAEVGLDHAGVEAALDAERERALEVAGVAPVAEERLRSTRRSRRARKSARRMASRNEAPQPGRDLRVDRSRSSATGATPATSRARSRSASSAASTPA